ncbi:UDP-forming cellulose synthase catalytic subunit [Pusillimonas sp. ANT_WB101]|uniref:UDP-forming cellulose synthase catalytic subunit n=1 Tax=Pusillimonas sp. ANT_WB101 TaxID=2597356 RepID=UPI0011ED573B|nr:UDP-forming cellulose synthase catalytic subunit [Pusillimonas sp. ANT_WB101]KAA0892606.1 UDP-forming cellulose synthase catalytic subunit [Pusillimonas sp. ANT_WB101]
MMEKFENWLVGVSLWRHGWVRGVSLVIAGLLGLAVVLTPFDLSYQFAFAVLTFAIAYALNKLSPARYITLVLMSISVATSLRYMYWRVTNTLGFETWLDSMFGYGLLLAEFYALTVLLLSYFQSAWPLHRKPVMLPANMDVWPNVDIYIPTYNEPLSVVRQTVLAALSQDWPADRLNIYLLDDGRRDEFQEFASLAGVGYLRRDNNEHAKAGNINAALARTDGEFIVIFDCDHIPSRSFLQICMGWFLKDPNLAMLQTPHVFFSPDPLEQNLEIFHNVPNESHLFYGLTQDGNDLWNATFFCGSCAVLRREHLLAVGGMAVESVTEDALTALKMNRLGFNTAYLAIPQAAGLATENLSRHIGQRIRWARGMAQIFRSHNPMLGKGLAFSQRICYLSAALHFFYSLPRVVFLTTPLAFLFFGAHVFHASALLIVVYAVPHILHAQLTNFRIQGKFRHTLWNEIFESVLAWYLMRPTIATLFKPDSAKFNVTAKGGTNEHSYFDWMLARPYIILLSLNLIGMMVGIVMLLWGKGDTSNALAIMINMVWTMHNVVICSASIAVAGERRQVRGSPRVRTNLRATLGLPNGHRIACTVSDFSQNGLGLVLPAPMGLAIGDAVDISLFRGDEEEVFPATARFVKDDRLGVRFDDLSIAQQIALTQMTFARADIWARVWNASVPDAPLQALKQISAIGWRGFSLLATETWREFGRNARNLTGRVSKSEAER